MRSGGLGACERVQYTISDQTATVRERRQSPASRSDS